MSQPRQLIRIDLAGLVRAGVVSIETTKSGKPKALVLAPPDDAPLTLKVSLGKGATRATKASKAEKAEKPTLGAAEKAAREIESLQAYTTDLSTTIEETPYSALITYARLWQDETGRPYVPERTVSADLRIMALLLKVHGFKALRAKMWEYFKSSTSYVQQRGYPLSLFQSMAPSIDVAPPTANATATTDWPDALSPTTSTDTERGKADGDPGPQK